MNLGQLTTLILNYLDDPNAGYFNAQFTTTVLNDAALKLQKMLLDAGQNYYFKCVQTQTVYGQNQYALPDDFRKEFRIEVVLSGAVPNEVKSQLPYITVNTQDFVQASVGAPQAYTIIKNKIQLFPYPDQAYTLRLFYAYQIPEMVNSYSVPDCPEYYHKYIAALAAKDGFVKDDRDDSKIIEMIKDLEEMIRQDAAERNQDESRDITMTDVPAVGMYY